ncbi:MAG: nickel-dependent lactate racemase [Chthoniobacterales bacterium]
MDPTRTVQLAYGRGFLDVELPGDRTDVIEPVSVPGLKDEKESFLRSLNHPIGSRSLREHLFPDARVCIVFTDITRATPNERIIPWLLEYLIEVVPASNITLINGTGTHRPNTDAELRQLLTDEVVERYRVLNHNADDPNELVQVGTTRAGGPALINRRVVEADVRISTGFIEPHFFAGFSGGPKGIMPGVAGLRTVLQNHSGVNLSNPQASFGVLEGNPIWEEMRDLALLVGESFLVNVTLNESREITGVFSGHLISAHREGCDFVRQTAMQKVTAPYEVVVTTNSGYPLDQNLYQAVKGMSAAARIVRKGGTIIIASECSDGVPNGSPYERLLKHSDSFEALFRYITDPTREEPEQWQVIVQMVIQRRAEVLVYSGLSDEKVSAAKLQPCHDIAQAVRERLDRAGDGARIAVLPQGPLTIPYLG